MAAMPAHGLDRDFWRGRRVLVTGHTGFTGGWLCLWLAGLGARVSGFALPPESQSLFAALGLEAGLDSHLGDLRDAPRLKTAIEATRPEIVLHLAAQSLVRRAHAAPIDSFAVNVMGTAHLLEALRGCDSLRSVVVVTSDKVYLNRGLARGYREADRLGGREPYAASKACAELVVDCYRHSYFEDRGIAIATARAGNIVGGGDWSADRLVPDAIRAFARREPLRLRHPHATRPWQHVLEACAGYLMLARALTDEAALAAGAWNFGPTPADSRPVAWIAGELARLWGEGAAWETHNPSNAPYEEKLLAVNAAKSAAGLGWKPRWTAGDALARTVPWYRAQIAGQSMRAVSTAQIEEYANAA